MTITIDSNDIWSIKAIEIAAGAGSWVSPASAEQHNSPAVPRRDETDL